MKLSLKFEMGSVEVELVDTPTTQALIEALPFESRTHTWGEEVYFATPIQAALEGDAKQVVEPGTACFWTEGDAIALPYGRTPISSDERPKLASRCNVLGRIEGNPRELAQIRAGQKITVSKA